MIPSCKLAIDVGWACNWRCTHCFYRRSPNWHGIAQTPTEAIDDRINRGRRGGLRHVVFIGQGEPTLDERTPSILRYARDKGMSTSIITNGTAAWAVYKRYFCELGLDHLHISSHGLGSTLDAISGVAGAFDKQDALKHRLQQENLPYRTNTTLQKLNYQQLSEIAEYEIGMGVRHFAFLGFLPHYEWRSRAAEVAVHPAELRPYIERAARILRDAGVLFTIRYHPFCHLDEDLWPHVVNANHATFCPWEWSYTIDGCENPASGQLMDHSLAANTARTMGEGVCIQGKPCSECLAARHCGRWNRFSAAGFNGAGLTPITVVPTQYADVWDAEGGLHDLNPANRHTGVFNDAP